MSGVGQTLHVWHAGFGAPLDSAIAPKQLSYLIYTPHSTVDSLVSESMELRCRHIRSGRANLEAPSLNKSSSRVPPGMHEDFLEIIQA